MIPKTSLFCLLIILSASIPVFAQDKAPVKFGKVSPEDFVLPNTLSDSNANAMVIADIGSSEFEGNSKGWFTLVFKRTTRIKILNKNGFDAANVEIPLYSDGNMEEKLDKLKAVTYNLENGKVVETKLDDKSVFKDLIRKNLAVRKFTLPAVKEGSIIEYTYTINSDFLFNLQPWEFQGKHPCYWSEYQVNIPEFFDYVFLSQGYSKFHIHKTQSSNQSFTLRDEGDYNRMETYQLSGNVGNVRWVVKDVMPLKEENYTSTLQNHISKIEFQLRGYRFPNNPPKEIMGNWLTVNEKLMLDEEFGVPINRNNNWLDDDIKNITGSSIDQLNKAKKIYSYVQENFTCTNHNGRYLTASLKNIMKSRNGSVADINLLLCAMLRHENIQANPVISGTRSHGYTNELYPIMDRFNYVICEANIDGKSYYLDATQAGIGFGRLPLECYNGHARVVSSSPHPIYFYPDSLVEKKMTMVIISNDDKGGLAGMLKSDDGYYESLHIRKKIKEKGETAFFKEISTAFNGDLTISDGHIDSLKELEQPVTVHYNFKMGIGGEDIIYFNPLFREGYKENMFKAADRKYPVEMPFTVDETFILNMEIPKGYQVEELPKSVKTTFNGDEGYFEYLIAKDEQRIQLRTRITLRKTTFMPDEYEPLRDFFGYVVKKHNEQFVLKKKKA